MTNRHVPKSSKIKIAIEYPVDEKTKRKLDEAIRWHFFFLIKKVNTNFRHSICLLT
jgi:hypothetical protein